MAQNEGDKGRAERLNQLYLAIISRYKSYIEEKEEISVAELPSLVLPKAQLVAMKANEIRGQFPSYQYDKDFLPAATAGFEFVRDFIEQISLPLQFWLNPDETLTFKLGDTIDKNILICSMLINLGNPDSKVIVIKREGSMEVYTYFEFNKRVYLADLSKGLREFESRDSMIETFRISEEDTAYEFNNQSYADIYPK